MTLATDTQRSFGGRFAMTGDLVETPLYDEHRARDAQGDIEVSLWVPRAALFATPVSRQRLANAAIEVRKVIHPSLRRLFAVGDSPAPWITLQPGRPLPPGRPSRAELVARIDAVAGALVALHQSGLVHGGVIETDVALVDGEARLGGGGVWTCADPDAMARTAPEHLAPERRAGGRASMVADAWSLAAAVARWVGGRELDAVLAPMLVEDPLRRSYDLPAFAAAARAALAQPYHDELATPVVAKGAPVGSAKGRRRKAQTTEEKTAVGHASGMHRGERTAGTDSDAGDADKTEPRERVPSTEPDLGPPRPATEDERTLLAMKPPPPQPQLPPVPRAPVPRAPVPRPPSSNPVPTAMDEVKSAPIVAVSMKPFDERTYQKQQQPTPPAPTPKLARPIMREPSREDTGKTMGRLAPPRAVVEAERQRSRRMWLAVLFTVLISTVVVLAVLVAT
jgi:hypothetical protein